MHSVGFLSLSFIVLLAGPVLGQPRRVPDDKPAQSTTAKSSQRQAFEFLDKDSNDALSSDEFLGGTLGKAAKAKLEEFKQLDADKSGTLIFQEFQHLESLRATPERLAKEFKRLDKDGDGKLTLEELLAGRSRPHQPQARRNFVRFDADRDGALTVEEFQRRGKGIQLTSEEQFKIRDEDGDGKLTEDEFLQPARGKPWEAGARRNFFKFDLDHDGTLTLSEFQILPPQKPSPAALFEGLDTDKDKKLTRDELVRIANPGELALDDSLFAEQDRNGDGTLDESEHLAYTKALSWIAWKERFWRVCGRWGPWLLLAFGLVLVVYIFHCVRVIRRRKRALRVRTAAHENWTDGHGKGVTLNHEIATGTDRPDRQGGPQTDVPTQKAAPSDTTPPTPETLEEFDIE